MEGDPVVDRLMIPVRAAIMRNVRADRTDAIRDIYNRAYEAVMNSLTVIGVMREQLSKANARAEAAEAKLAVVSGAIRLVKLNHPEVFGSEVMANALNIAEATLKGGE